MTGSNRTLAVKGRRDLDRAGHEPAGPDATGGRNGPGGLDHGRSAATGTLESRWRAAPVPVTIPPTRPKTTPQGLAPEAPPAPEAPTAPEAPAGEFPSLGRRVAGHLALLACYLLAGVAATWPRVTYLTGRLPATGDSASYVWSFWWL